MGRHFSLRSPVGAPVPLSSGLANRFRQRSLRQYTISTPSVEFAIASRGFQRRQGQYALRRPTHSLVFTVAETSQSLYFSTRVLAIHNPARCRCW